MAKKYHIYITRVTLKTNQQITKKRAKAIVQDAANIALDADEVISIKVGAVDLQ